MKTILDIVNLSATYLKKKNIERPRRQAEQLIADVLGVGRLDLYLQFEHPLEENELKQCRLALKRRAKGEPLQHIMGEVLFAGVQIKVNPSVLIPRLETEILVEKIFAILSKKPQKGKILWDICCGSGCMGIALAKKFPDLKIILSDLSLQSLAVAKENAALNRVDVSFYHGDLFVPFKKETTDYLVCNPPYVAEKDFLELSTEVRDFEPKMALVAGQTGLEFYKKIAIEISAFLNPEARAWFEIGSGQGKKIEALFKQKGWKCSFESDWAGHDRFFSLKKSLQLK